MFLFVVILRPPGLRPGFFQDDGGVVERACQGIAPDQRCQVDGGFDQGADRAPGVEGPVKFTAHRLAAAGQGHDLTALPVADNGSPFQTGASFLLFQAVEGAGELFFHLPLHLGIEGGEDLQTAAVEVLLTIVILQLPADQVEKCREPVESAQHLSDFDEWCGHCLLVAFFVDDLPVAHDLQDHRPSLQAAFRILARIIVGWAFDHGDEEGDLIGREIFEIAAEIKLAGQSRSHARRGRRPGRGRSRWHRR